MSFSPVMRAIRVSEFGGPSVLKLCSNVKRPTPKEHEVLIKVHAVGINPIDTHIRANEVPGLATLPYTPGSDLAGAVQAVGPGVSKFKAGDRVFTMGTVSGAYAEYATASEISTFKLHDNLTYEQGASLGIPYLTAYKALMVRGGAKAGESILVHGASGGVGLPTCQMGRAFGMKVVGTAGTEAGLELALANGAEQVYNHRNKDYMQKIKEWTGGKGIDVIVEMLANANLAKDLELLAPNGRVIVIGNHGETKIDAGLTMWKETDIRGLLLLASTDAEINVFGEAVVKGAKDGWVKPIVGVEFNLEDADKAHEEVMAHKQGTKGKIVLKI